MHLLTRISQINLLGALSLTATLVFSLAGGLTARAAVSKNSPSAVVAIFCAGFLTANGGGTVRDLALAQAPFWLFDASYLLASALTTVLVLAIRELVAPKAVGAVAIADDLSTGIFVVFGVSKIATLLPLDSPYFVLTATLSGVVTGVGGGILRDWLLQRGTPVIFASPCLVNVIACSGFLALLTSS